MTRPFLKGIKDATEIGDGGGGCVEAWHGLKLGDGGTQV